MDGVLNVNKPQGMTSHDVVQEVRRLLAEKRVGHTGTLDPLATGVLVLCIGKATRIAQYLEAGEKEYHATMRLGVTTDTLDAEGSVLETKSYRPLQREQIISAMDRFRGPILQRPPAYSALKVAGIPSYKLARQGKAKLHDPRPVHVHVLELKAYEDPDVSFFVRCSKGMYVRSLCADIGNVLGTGAHLIALTRTRSGRFSIEQSFTLKQLASMTAEGNIEHAIMQLDEALSNFPAVPLDETNAKRIRNGGAISCPASLADSINDLVRIHNSSGAIVALGRVVAGAVKPELVFSNNNE